MRIRNLSILLFLMVFVGKNSVLFCVEGLTEHEALPEHEAPDHKALEGREQREALEARHEDIERQEHRGKIGDGLQEEGRKFGEAPVTDHSAETVVPVGGLPEMGGFGAPEAPAQDHEVASVTSTNANLEGEFSKLKFEPEEPPVQGFVGAMRKGFEMSKDPAKRPAEVAKAEPVAEEPEPDRPGYRFLSKREVDFLKSQKINPEGLRPYEIRSKIDKAIIENERTITRNPLKHKQEREQLIELKKKAQENIEETPYEHEGIEGMKSRFDEIERQVVYESGKDRLFTRDLPELGISKAEVRRLPWVREKFLNSMSRFDGEFGSRFTQKVDPTTGLVHLFVDRSEPLTPEQKNKLSDTLNYVVDIRTEIKDLVAKLQKDGLLDENGNLTEKCKSLVDKNKIKMLSEEVSTIDIRARSLIEHIKLVRDPHYEQRAHEERIAETHKQTKVGFGTPDRVGTKLEQRANRLIEQSNELASRINAKGEPSPEDMRRLDELYSRSLDALTKSLEKSPMSLNRKAIEVAKENFKRSIEGIKKEQEKAFMEKPKEFMDDFNNTVESYERKIERTKNAEEKEALQKVVNRLEERRKELVKNLEKAFRDKPSPENFSKVMEARESLMESNDRRIKAVEEEMANEGFFKKSWRSLKSIFDNDAKTNLLQSLYRESSVLVLSSHDFTKRFRNGLKVKFKEGRNNKAWDQKGYKALSGIEGEYSDTISVLDKVLNSLENRTFKGLERMTDGMKKGLAGIRSERDTLVKDKEELLNSPEYKEMQKAKMRDQSPTRIQAAVRGGPARVELSEKAELVEKLSDSVFSVKPEAVERLGHEDLKKVQAAVEKASEMEGSRTSKRVIVQKAILEAHNIEVDENAGNSRIQRLYHENSKVGFLPKPLIVEMAPVF